MTNILEKFLGDALDGIIMIVSKNIEEQSKIREEKKKREKLRKKSIDVEFKVKEDKQNDKK